MGLDAAVSGLIARIYQGAHDRALWPGVLDEIVARTRSRFIMVSVVDTRRNAYVSTDFHGPQESRFLDGVRDYDAEVYKADPTLSFALRHPRAGFVSTRSALADAGEEMDGNPYLRWTREVLGVGQSIVRYAPVQGGLVLGVSLHPDAARQAHDADDLALFKLLFAHVEGAMRLAIRPPALLAPDAAWLLLDARGLVRSVSEPARVLLAEADGLAIVGRQLVAGPRERPRLEALVRAAAGAVEHGGAGGRLVVQRASGRPGLLVRVVPVPALPGPFVPLAAAVAVTIIDPLAAPPPADGAEWRAMFGFTPAETRLALALLSGDGTLRQHADALGLTYGTARVHLRHLFDKAQVRSQAQLIRLLSRLA